MRPLALLLVAVLAPVMRPVDACHASAPFIEPMPHGQLHRLEEAVDEAVFDNCFLAGTNVETASRGGVAVEDVRLGDRFAPPPGHSCDDPHCGEVVRLFPGQTDQVVTITAVARPRAREHRASGSGDASGDGEDAEPPSASQTIRCTPGHPFFVQGRGWVLAGDLRAGDELEARGERVVVAAVEVRAEQAETFNFEVACHHTYRVSGAAGQPAVLVHNTSRVLSAALGRRTRYAANKLRAMRANDGRIHDLAPGRVWFRGHEVRAVRSLSGLSTSTVRMGAAEGFAPRIRTSIQGERWQSLHLHHHQQRVGGPIIEMPGKLHTTANPRQHPLGNTGGVGSDSPDRGAFNTWRVQYWKARWSRELESRGLQ